MTVWYAPCINRVVSPDDGHSLPKHIEIDKFNKNKYIKNKLCTNLVLFTRLYRYARSSKRKMLFHFNNGSLFLALPVKVHSLVR